MVTREQFFDAVESGDARSIAAFFAQRTRGYVPDGDVVALVDAHERRAGYEWLRPFDEYNQYTKSTSLLSVAIESGYVEVLEWLFSADAIVVMEPQQLTAVLHQACPLALRTNALELLELLFTSPVFEALLPHEHQQLLVDRLLRVISGANTADAVRLLTAHGACVHTQVGEPRESAVLRQIAHRGTPELLDAIVRDGALTAGVAIFREGFARPRATTRPLLALGSGPRNAASCLHRTVSFGQLSMAKVWLECGFLDVDARDMLGQTPLMRVHRLVIGHGRRLDWGGGAGLAKLLLEYGSDVTAKDSNGWTPLRHAINSRSSYVIRLLLEHGADPNQPTDGNRVALDFLDVDRVNEPWIAEQLTWLLQFGANPFLPGLDGRSTVDRLQQTEQGRAFLAQGSLVAHTNTG